MASKVENILMAGVGGQGIVLASDILTLASLNAGYDAKKSEIHGMSQRGGSVFSHVRFGEKVHSPVIPFGEADILVSFEEMETLRWQEYLKADSKIMYATTRILPSGLKEYPQGIDAALRAQFKDVIAVNAEEFAKKAGSPKAVNVAILGLLSRYINFPEHAWQKAIEQEVPAGTFEMNWKAFLTGKEFSA